MNNDYIIYDSRKLAAYNIALELCKDKGFDEQFFTELWEGVLYEPVLFDEFMYYLQTNEINGHFQFEGYSLFDLYFYHLGDYNFSHDLGKNPVGCDKEAIALMAFHTMTQFIKNPLHYRKILTKDLGMDFGL